MKTGRFSAAADVASMFRGAERGQKTFTDHISPADWAERMW